MKTLGRLRLNHVRMAALTASLLLLFPPAGMGGSYSTLEVALALLVIAALPSTAVPATSRLAAPTALVLLVALMATSSLWSIASWLALRDASTYAVLAIAALVLARSLSVAELATAVASMGAIVLVASVLLALISPARAFDSWGVLQGIYDNHNSLGYVLVQAIPGVLAVPLAFRGGLLVRLSALAAFGWAIVETGAKTALISGIIIVAIWVAIILVRRWRVAIIGIVLVVVVVVVVGLLNVQSLLAFLGKDATGSGRTMIWHALLPVIGAHPLLGNGWASSWPIGSPQYEAMITTFGKPLFHAHNEVFNWLVTLGVVGLILVVAVYGFVAWSGWRAFVARVPAASFLLLTLAMIISRGLTEISETSAQGWLVLALAAAAGAQFVVRDGHHISKAVVLRLPDSSSSS